MNSLSHPHPNLSSRYYHNGRPSLAAMVPLESQNILDIGCGRGFLGGYLKDISPGRTVCGIDMDLANCQSSAPILDQVFHADATAFELPMAPKNFDCIILADVIEHVIDPVSLISRYKPFLKRDGCFLLSIPNMRHRSAIWRILTKGWHYDDCGLFDRTHLRFYSRASMLELLSLCDLSVTRMEGYRGSKDRLLNATTFGMFEEFLTFQYYIQARLTSPS